ncbi:MAG: ABC transporter permease subunit, partial [Candidatus Dadabacteria bacterium]|nr:ABC transporter permease subunit [Candidatus Dadabacteria bacterium]
MDTKNVFLIMRKEAVESLRNRWFILYTICFSALALLVLLFSTMGGDIAGFSGFGRTAASLINLVLLFVPLIAIITGGMSISQERENGTLPYLLSHPINKNEIFVGKFLGILITIWFSILLVFGLAGLGVAIRGGEGEISGYLLPVILSALLAAFFLSLGFLVSVY